MENRIVINRKSPPNEKQYIEAYKKIVLSAAKTGDGFDIAAVKLQNGEPGYALVREEINRSRDKSPHRGKSFVSTTELKKVMKQR